jgi:hypothetical protein
MHLPRLSQPPVRAEPSDCERNVADNQTYACCEWSTRIADRVAVFAGRRAASRVADIVSMSWCDVGKSMKAGPGFGSSSLFGI